MAVLKALILLTISIEWCIVQIACNPTQSTNVQGELIKACPSIFTNFDLTFNADGPFIHIMNLSVM